MRLGKRKLFEESNIVSILRTLQKLKAAVSVLVDKDIDLKPQIEKVYVNNQTLYLNKKEFQSLKVSQMDNFYEFLEQDIRDTIKFENFMTYQ